MDSKKVYPRSGDRETVYLKSVITNPSIIVGDYTMYNDFVNDPTLFEKITSCTITRSIMTSYISESFALLLAEQDFSLTVQTTV